MADPSGKFVLRISPELHSRLRRQSSRVGVSLNDLCRAALEACVAKDAPHHEPHGDQKSAHVDTAARVLGDELLGVVLFGSVARGEATDSSDTDLLLVTSSSVALSRELYRRWDEHCADSNVSPHFVRIPDAPESAGSIWYEVALDGIVLYERDCLVTRTLQTLRRVIANGLIQRRYSHGHPYWVRRTEGAHAQ